MARKPYSQRILPNREKRGFGVDSDGGGVSDRQEEKEGTDPYSQSTGIDDLNKSRGIEEEEEGAPRWWEGSKKRKAPPQPPYQQIKSRGMPAPSMDPNLTEGVRKSALKSKAYKSPFRTPFEEAFPGHPRTRKKDGQG